MKRIKFEDFIPNDLLTDLYSLFNNYIKEKQTEPFINEVEKFFTGRYEDNVKKLLTNMGENYDRTNIVQLLTSNAYQIAPIKLVENNHNFTLNEKINITAFSFFINSLM